ncbi:Hypothetical protein CINCED_3A012358 [Cinara cedri]|nr:Hypothetical protein CINCED_3A012358 [Cinara cedri]
MLPLRVLPPQDADHHQHHHHHHHHVIYYFSVEPDRVAGRNIRLDSRRPSCDGHHQPVEVPGFPPEYLPPSPPQVPQIPQIPPPTTTQPPCDDDDTVIVDNVDYYPFGKKPIVVASESVVLNRTQLPNQSPPRNVSNFILSNYLLPPNK